MRWRAVLLGLVACAPARPLPLPIDDGAQALLLIEPGAGHLLGINLLTGEGLEPGALRRDRALYARSYSGSLASLGLAPGRTPLVGMGPSHRALPTGLSTYRAELSADPPTWRLLDRDVADRELAEVFLPGANESCEIDGGCWITERGEPVCILPCPSLAPLLAPARPMAPDLPQLGPCPGPWTTSTSTINPDVQRCVPPELSCPPGEYRSLVDAACQPDLCPADGWPADAPPQAIYVDPGAAAGGDGSRAAPFATLATALGAAREGSVLALRAGEHPAGVSAQGVRLLGACRSQVILLPSAVPRLPTLSVAGGVVGVRGLTLRAAANGSSLRIFRSAQAELDEVIVEGGSAGGALVDQGARLLARSTAISGGGTLLAVNSGTAELVACQLEGRGSNRCLDATNSELVLSDVEFKTCGDGVILSGGGLIGERLSFRDPTQESLTMSGSATATISQLYVDGGTNGVLVQPAARLRLARYFATGLLGRGISAMGGELTLQDILLEETRETGLELRQSRVVGRRVALAKVGRNGIFATGGPTELEDLRIEDVRAPTPNLTSLYGLQLDGPTILRRVEVEVSAGPGLYFRSGAGQRNELELSDLRIAALPAPRFLPAIYLSSGVNANVSARRVEVLDWPGTGLLMQGLTAAIEDLNLEANGEAAMEVLDASFSLRRARISGTATVAAAIEERAGSTMVELESIEVQRGAGSYGLRTRGLASGTHLLSVRDFRINGPAAAAFDIDYVFYLELERGRIEGAQVGLRLEQPSFPLSAVEEQIYYLNVAEEVDIRCRTTSPDCQD